MSQCELQVSRSPYWNGQCWCLSRSHYMTLSSQKITRQGQRKIRTCQFEISLRKKQKTIWVDLLKRFLCLSIFFDTFQTPGLRLRVCHGVFHGFSCPSGRTTWLVLGTAMWRYFSRSLRSRVSDLFSESTPKSVKKVESCEI